MFFNKVAGRGYPLYTGGAFDQTVFRSAETSFKLKLDGGSVAYQLAAGRLPLNPNADYYIIGFVKTTALQHARAELAAWFADEQGKPIPASECHSQQWASADGTDDWHVLHLYMPGNAPAARSLILQVGLLQPQQLSDRRLGQFELYQQDIKGAAWFDDIVVFQLPRLSLSTPAVGNIFGPGQNARLDMAISDLGRPPADRLTATLNVTDAEGGGAYKQSWTITTDPMQPWNKEVVLPALPAGLYLATLDIFDTKGLITRRTTRFAVTAAVGGGRPAPEFGLVASAWPVEAWDELPALAGHSGAGLVKLPAWRKDMSENSLLRNDQPFDRLVTALGRQDIGAIASFGEVPSVLTQKLTERGDSVLALLEADPAVWRPYVSFILSRYAARVGLWELGRDSDGFTTGDNRYVRLFAKAHGEFADMLPNPRLIIPWNALYDFDPKLYPNAMLDLRIPALIKPGQIPTYLGSFTRSKTEVLAVIEPLDAARYSRMDRLRDFAQRIVLARSASPAPRAVLIDLPMTREATLGGARSQPDELLLVYRTLARMLGGAAFKRELTLAPGVRAFLFDRDGVGTLVLWNEKGATPAVAVNLAVGRTSTMIDLFGRNVPLAADGALARITANSTPLLVDGVDTRWLELRGSFALAQTHVPAGTGVLETQVLLENPLAEALVGSLHLQAAPGWTVDPPLMEVSLPPGGKLARPVTLRYPFTEFAGPKTLRARLTLDRDSGRTLEMETFLTLASERVEMECLAHFAPNGELVLQQMITNTGATALNAQAYAMVPGYPRQQRFVLDLKPNQTLIKRFNFPNAADLVGKSAVLGLRQTDGQTLLTKSVPLN